MQIVVKPRLPFPYFLREEPAPLRRGQGWVKKDRKNKDFTSKQGLFQHPLGRGLKSYKVDVPEVLIRGETLLFLISGMPLQLKRPFQSCCQLPASYLNQKLEMDFHVNRDRENPKAQQAENFLKYCCSGFPLYLWVV